MNDFRMVLLKDIAPDPNQPRQIYDEVAMDELTNSVREKGILQPLLLRINPDYNAETGNKPFLIVCGERRYRAAVSVNAAFKDRNSVPAVIRELSDEEAMELQIIENLQRKDVHPMEEAVAFKSLLEKGKDIKEIAVRVGKSEFYARQRVKLCDLIEDWQKAFYAGRVLHKDALTLSAFDKGIQQEIWKEQSNGKGNISFTSWYLSRFTGLLANATFNLADPTVNKKAGPCTTCPFNSAVQSLFPDADKEPKCSKITCFKVKTDRQFDLSLANAKAEPGIIFVNTMYQGYEDGFTRQLEKDGFTYLNGTGRGNIDLIEEPSRPDVSEYDLEDYDSEQEMLDDYASDLKTYEAALKKYLDKIEGGKYNKAFAIHGEYKGRFVFLQIGKTTSGSGTAQKTKEKEKSGKLTTADIELEIKRIQDGEKRKKELDLNNVHKGTLQALDAIKAIKAPGLAHQGKIDRAIMIFCLIQNAGYAARNVISTKLKSLPKEAGYSKHGYAPDYFQKLGEVSDDDLAFIVRAIAMDKWGCVNMQGDVRAADTTIRMMAEYTGVDLKAIEDVQAEVAVKRQGRVDKRIAELQEKKAELKKPVSKKESKKPPVKKDAKKSSPKKSVKKS